uniref:dTCF n=1 Tax=Panagrellus redivivus TaxID=6233 RepID=A0A7E4VKP7_PANRE
MGDAIDDCADEVKVFRKNDAEELAAESIQSSAQLHEDKQDVAFEAEIETQNSLASGLKGPMLPFSHLGPLSSNFFSPYSSPAYAYAAMAMSPNHFNPIQQMLQCQLMRGLMAGSAPSTSNQMHSPMESKPSTSNGGGSLMSTPKRKKESRESKKERIKKPLNAFMWFMKDNRQKVLSEDGNSSKQSAELNTILGKMWHDLPKEEQQRYYEKAKEERENHAKLYPNWSARENYSLRKAKRKKRESSADLEQKKCRARFGVHNTDQWCKHCRRKKRCLLVRDSESPMPTNGNGMNPATPHNMPMSPASSGFSTSSRACSANTSEEDDLKDVKPNMNMTPKTPQQNFNNAMPAMMNFAAMSPSFNMFTFPMHFGNQFASMMQPYGNMTPNLASPAVSNATPTLQSLN